MSNPSKLWHGVLWACKALKFGYRWHVGNVKKINFWEDTWFGTSPLSMQFWPIYTICNQHCVTLSEVWDGTTIKLSFRRAFSGKLLESWMCIEQILHSVTYTEGEDALIWQYDSKGVYTTSSLYSIINFRGVQLVYIPSVWSVVSPPRVQIFLWLLANNSLMTRDNLEKRNMGKPLGCEFCAEPETIDHLFFSCAVAKNIWNNVSDYFDKPIGQDYLSVARFWPAASKNHCALNSICSCILWSIWKSRNQHVFNNAIWSDVKQIWRDWFSPQSRNGGSFSRRNTSPRSTPSSRWSRRCFGHRFS